MKTKLAALMMLLIASTQTFASLDGNDRVFLVVENINGEGEFLIERAPIIGCYGLEQGARLDAFASEYKAPQNIGCGGVVAHEDINALSCAKLVDAKESADYRSFSEITLDISKCEAKNNANFITMVRTAAKRNFPQADRKREVALKLVK